MRLVTRISLRVNLIRVAALLAVIAAAPGLFAQQNQTPLAQPEVAVAGYDCCECAPDCGCEPNCACEPSCGCETGCCEPSCGCEAGCGDCCGCDCCCREVCVASVEKEKVEKHCWKVECDKICIPKVVCPWGEGGSGLTLFSWMKKKGCNSGCGDACCADVCGTGCCSRGCCSSGCCNGCCPKPRCGKVRCVRDIKKETYECDTCVCKWEIKRLPPCCGDGCCGDACCGESCGCGSDCCVPCCADPCCGASSTVAPTAASELVIQTVSAETDLELPAAEEVEETEDSTESVSWLRRMFSSK